MIKAIIMGAWAGTVVLASQYGANHYAEMQAESKKKAAVTIKLETRKTNEINIPKIKNGIVRGYVVVRLNYVVDMAALASTKLSPEIFISDELFKYIYGDDSIDFDRL